MSNNAYGNVDFSSLPPNILQSLAMQQMQNGQIFGGGGGGGGAGGQGQAGFAQMGGMNMGNMSMGNVPAQMAGGVGSGGMGNMNMNLNTNMGMGMGNMGNMGNMSGGGGGAMAGMGNGNVGNMGDFANFGVGIGGNTGNQQQAQGQPNFPPAINNMSQAFQAQAYPQQPQQTRQMPNNFVPPNQQQQGQQRTQMTQHNQGQGQVQGQGGMYAQNPNTMPARAPTPQGGNGNGSTMLPAQMQQQQQNQGNAGGMAAKLNSFQRLQSQESQRQEQQRLGMPVNPPSGGGGGGGGIGVDQRFTPQMMAQIQQQLAQGQNQNGQLPQQSSQQVMAHVQQALAQQQQQTQRQQQQQQQQQGQSGPGQVAYNLSAMMSDLQQQGQGALRGQVGQGQGQAQGGRAQQIGMPNQNQGGVGMVDAEADRRQALSSNNPSNGFTPSLPPSQPPSQPNQQAPQAQQTQRSTGMPQPSANQSSVPTPNQNPNPNPNQNQSQELYNIISNMEPGPQQDNLMRSVSMNGGNSQLVKAMLQHYQQSGNGAGASNATNQALMELVKNSGIQAQGQGQQGQGQGQRGMQQPQQQQQQQGKVQQISVQGQTPQMGNLQGLPHDKQLEQLQLMKDRQARQTGLITPQMAGGQLPMVSPGGQSAQMANQHTQRQQSQSQPQPQPPQMPQQANQQFQQQMNQGQNANQQGAVSYPQTTPQQGRASLPQGAQGMQGNPAQGQGQMGQQGAQMMPQQGARVAPQQQRQQGQDQSSGMASAQRALNLMSWLRTQSDENVISHTPTVIRKLADPSQSAPNDDTPRQSLLYLLSEYRRRNLPVHEELQRVILKWLDQGAEFMKWDADTLFQTANKFSMAQGMQGGDQRTTANIPNQPQNPAAGSATNPIEIGGSTPAMSVASLGPSQTPLMQYGQLPGQQGHMRQPSFGAGTQPNPQMMQQQQQQRPPMPTQNSNGPARRDYDGLDFSSEPIPFRDEAQLWTMVVRMNSNGNDNLSRPMIAGQPVDLFNLLLVVHKNGGSAKLENSLQQWQTIAGHLGFHSGRDQGQAPRSTPEIANQVRQVYALYLSKLEHAMYSQLYRARMANMQSQQMQGGGGGSAEGGASQQTGPAFGQLNTNQQYAALLAQTQAHGTNIPAHLLDSIGKAAAGNGLPANMTGNLTEQQKRYAEEQRRIAQAQAQQGQVPNRTPNMGPPVTPAGAGGTPQLAPGMLGPAGMQGMNVQNLQMLQNIQANMGGNGNTAEAQQAMLAQMQASRAMQHQQNQREHANAMNSMKHDPALVVQYVRSRERLYTEKCLKSEVSDVADSDKPGIVHELRSVNPVAREAKEKVLRFLWLASELKQDATPELVNLISHYTILHVSLARAEEGAFINNKETVARIRSQFEHIWFSANQTFEALRQTPEGASRLSRLSEFYARGGKSEEDKKPGNVSAGAQASASGSTTIAANLPKGLRMEDLKPPPAKRAKGKNGAAAPGQSPAQTGQTPESARTPAAQLPGDSPVNTTSPARKPAPKRKRGATANTKASKDETKDVPPTPTIATPIVPPNIAPVPILDEHAAFFKARFELENAIKRVGKHDVGDAAAAVAADVDVWAALASAVEDLSQMEQAQGGLGSAPLAPGVTANPGSASKMSVEDDLFAQWIDTAQLAELPTPDLYHGSLYEDDTSPESIKTVGSTTGMFFGNPAAAMASGSTAKAAGDQTDPAMQGPAGVNGTAETRAYNGSLFWDDSYDFTGNSTAQQAVL